MAYFPNASLQRGVQTISSPSPLVANIAWKRFLEGDTLTMAVIIDIVRADGEVMGFTTHDADLLIWQQGELPGISNTLLYEALDSVTASALRQEIGRGIDNLDVYGILSSDRITEEDMRAGLYDGAAVRISVVNYAEPDLNAWSAREMPPIVLMRGTIGQVTIADNKYTAEFRSLMQKLSQNVGRVVSPTCDVRQFADSLTENRCKLVAATYQFAATLTAVDDSHTLRFTVTNGGTADYFSYGRVIVNDGANAGLAREIKSHTALAGPVALIVLQRAFPFDFTLADDITLEAGCDRLIGTCNGKFFNVTNFRGFSQLPGNETLQKRGRPPESG